MTRTITRIDIKRERRTNQNRTGTCWKCQVIRGVMSLLLIVRMLVGKESGMRCLRRELVVDK